MGTYLTTAMIHTLSVSKSDVEKVAADQEKAIRKIEKSLLGLAGLFSIEKETESTYHLGIKEKLIKKELLPFLTEFYEDFYGKEDAYGRELEYKDVLEALNAKETPMEWLDLLENGSFSCFQEDYSSYVNIEVNGEKIQLGYRTIMLSMEGKVMVEQADRHLSFFKRLIPYGYPNYKLANLMTVYITG